MVSKSQSESHPPKCFLLENFKQRWLWLLYKWRCFKHFQRIFNGFSNIFLLTGSNFHPSTRSGANARWGHGRQRKERKDEERRPLALRNPLQNASSDGCYWLFLEAKLERSEILIQGWWPTPFVVIRCGSPKSHSNMNLISATTRAFLLPTKIVWIRRNLLVDGGCFCPQHACHFEMLLKDRFTFDQDPSGRTILSIVTPHSDGRHRLKTNMVSSKIHHERRCNDVCIFGKEEFPFLI